MRLTLCTALVLGSAFASTPCTPPPDTTGADDGNPHCWDRIRRCDGPNAHPDGGPGYQPPCGLCEGLGGIVWGDNNEDITLPKCKPIAVAADVSPKPVVPAWGREQGKFTISNDRFIMIGKKTDPFCFKFFPSNNSQGSQCYRRQTGTMYYDLSAPTKAIRYDLNIHIPWPSDQHSVFGNISTIIMHQGPNMWIVNKMYNLVHQCICTQPHSTAGHGSHNLDPIYPVMFNWTNHLSYVGREEIDVEYGVGPLQLDHWNYGPHHAWTKVGDDKIVRMWQPYNGFEVFEPGSFQTGVADPKVFDGMVPPPLCKKGGATMRIGCTDDGYPKPTPTGNEDITAAGEPAMPSDLRRARTKVPRRSHKGSDFQDMSMKLNRFLSTFKGAKECTHWSTAELQKFQAVMLMLRAPEMDDIYKSASDNRQLRGDVEAHRERWDRHATLASKHGDAYAEMHRDGHCHEAVMWFVHHIAEPARQQIAEFMPVPMLPYAKHECPSASPDQEQKSLCDEYVHQVSCQDCHQDATASASSLVI